MSFAYKGKCYDSALELNSAVAADCPAVSGNYFGITCLPTSTDISVSVWFPGDLASTPKTTGTNFVPAQIDCITPDLSVPTELAWLVGGVWILAWGIRKIMQLLPGG